MEYSRKLKFPISEDSISDLTGLEIARFGIKVYRTTGRAERYVGFDWEWFIGNTAQGYAHIAVQAKKQSLYGDETYRNLRHPAGPVHHQIDVLEAWSYFNDAIPLYCFYNNVCDEIAAGLWNCSDLIDVPQIGCTLVSLDDVRSAHDRRIRKDFITLHENNSALPWRCLFHPKCRISHLLGGKDWVLKPLPSYVEQAQFDQKIGEIDISGIGLQDNLQAAEGPESIGYPRRIMILDLM